MRLDWSSQRRLFFGVLFWAVSFFLFHNFFEEEKKMGKRVQVEYQTAAEAAAKAAAEAEAEASAEVTKTRRPKRNLADYKYTLFIGAGAPKQYLKDDEELNAAIQALAASGTKKLNSIYVGTLKKVTVKCLFEL